MGQIANQMLIETIFRLKEKIKEKKKKKNQNKDAEKKSNS